MKRRLPSVRLGTPAHTKRCTSLFRRSSLRERKGQRLQLCATSHPLALSIPSSSCSIAYVISLSLTLLVVAFVPAARNFGG
jgi:hypothetical protein